MASLRWLFLDVKTFTETPAAQSTLCCPSEHQVEQFWLGLGLELSDFWAYGLINTGIPKNWFTLIRLLLKFGMWQHISQYWGTSIFML